MTDVFVSQLELRRRNALAAKVSRRMFCSGLAVSAVALLAANIFDDVRQPHFHEGAFSADFSDDFDIDRWEYRFPLGIELDVTAHSAYVQNKNLGIGFTVSRW